MPAEAAGGEGTVRPGGDALAAPESRALPSDAASQAGRDHIRITEIQDFRLSLLEVMQFQTSYSTTNVLN